MMIKDERRVFGFKSSRSRVVRLARAAAELFSGFIRETDTFIRLSVC